MLFKKVSTKELLRRSVELTNSQHKTISLLEEKLEKLEKEDINKKEQLRLAREVEKGYQNEIDKLNKTIDNQASKINALLSSDQNASEVDLTGTEKDIAKDMSKKVDKKKKKVVRSKRKCYTIISNRGVIYK